MKLIPLPAFTDNYIWMQHDGREALAVAPGDAQPVLDVPQQLGVQLGAILVMQPLADQAFNASSSEAAGIIAMRRPWESLFQ